MLQLMQMSKMSGFLNLFVGLVFLSLAVAASPKFDQVFQSTWASDHLIHDGDFLKLKLDHYSGASFGSKSKYMFGKVTMPGTLLLSISIWNADDWATQGGSVKTNWSHAPFFATYKAFEVKACECPVSVAAIDNAKRCSSTEDRKYWWDEPTLSVLSLHQTHQLMWVRANHMVYDYCSDTVRFPLYLLSVSITVTTSEGK